MQMIRIHMQIYRWNKLVTLFTKMLKERALFCFLYTDLISKPGGHKHRGKGNIMTLMDYVIL